MPPLNCSSPNPRRVAAPSIAVSRIGAKALRYALEDLRIPKAFGAWVEVGDERFNSSEIQRLYDADDYPLRKPRALVRNETDGAPLSRPRSRARGYPDFQNLGVNPRRWLLPLRAL
jgi:hypothetical protein